MPLALAEAICESEALLVEAAPVVFLELVVAAGAIEFDVLLAGAAAGVDAGTADDLLLFIAPASDGAAADVPAEPGWPAVPASAFAFFLLLFLDAELSAGALAAPVELAAALPCMALVSDFLLFLEVFEGVLLAADSPADTADPVWSAVALDFLLFLEVLVEGSEVLVAADWSLAEAVLFLDFLVVFLVEAAVWSVVWSCEPLWV